MTDSFCDRAWNRTERLQRAMMELPFNTELAAGRLSLERFRFYLAQDAQYLVGFGRALAVAAARAADQDDVAFFAGAAREAIVVERELHTGYFERFGMTSSDVETSPTCLAYTSYLLATAQTAGYPDLIAALLPCFWVYEQVGREIQATGQPDNPFQAWIDTYADDDFSAAVQACRDAVDRAAAAADESTRDRMFAAFARATEYEWLFWDSAYKLEAWPTASLRVG